MTAKPLGGQVAVVTGGSRGIGRAIAVELASLGAQVVCTARTDSPRDDIAGTLAETVDAITSAGGAATGHRADLLVPEDLDALVASVLDRHGHLDILVNNAAYIGDAVFESFWDMSSESWSNMIELNVTVPWRLTKAFAPAMRARGRGIVVNLSSSASRAPAPGTVAPLPGAGGLGAAYPTSKAALTHMTAHVGNELRAEGIAMVALDPGFAHSESAEILASRIGADVAWAQPVEVAAKATAWIATCPEPLNYAGAFIVARELVDEYGLLPAGT
jgi:NAD(P)-dependent dehydrogenase (short-subunit alcohol dehydrogenase family)